MKTDKKLNVKGVQISISQQNKNDYISLTDIARYKNREATGIIIANWLRNKYTIEFVGIWEQIHNENFNVIEFDNIKNQRGIPKT